MKITAAISFVLLLAAPLAAQKKAKPEPEPPKMYPTERTFAASCDAVWPAGLQVLAANGWAIKTSDRAGGLLTFERTQIERMRSFKDFIARYTTGKTTGFWTTWTGFRFGVSQAIVTESAGKCSYSLAMAYEGFGNQGAGAYSPTQWWSLISNGWFENKMLDDIAAKVAAKRSEP